MTPDDFRAKRAALGWTQADTSKALGLSVNQIRAIENGRSSVTKTVALLFELYRFPDHPSQISTFVQLGREAAKRSTGEAWH